jgi:hypothetical protein
MAPGPASSGKLVGTTTTAACVKVDVCGAPLQPLDQAQADRQQQRTKLSLKQCALLGRGTQQPRWHKATL